jgi:hypothetical protein
MNKTKKYCTIDYLIMGVLKETQHDLHDIPSIINFLKKWFEDKPDWIHLSEFNEILKKWLSVEINSSLSTEYFCESYLCLSCDKQKVNWDKFITEFTKVIIINNGIYCKI